MPIATLTWNMVGPISITSGSLPSGGSTGAQTKQFLMYTLQQLVQSSSYWLVDVQDVTGSATEALVLKPNPSLSDTPNMRIVCTMNVSGALGGASTGSIMQDFSAGTADAFVANSFLMGFSPNISNAPTWVTGSWNSDRPWGPTVRWSKYWAGFLNASVSAEQMYLIESQEALFVGFRGRRGNTNHFAIGAGAFIQSADSGSGEMVTGSTGRVFGMTRCAGGGSTTAIATNWLNFGNSANANTGQGLFGLRSVTQSDASTGVFIVSGGVPNAMAASGQANSNTWELVVKASTYQPSQPSDTAGDRGTNVTSGDTLVGWPIPIVSGQSPIRFIGFLRQIYVINDVPALVAIATGTNNPGVVGYSWGPDVWNANDAVIFANV